MRLFIDNNIVEDSLLFSGYSKIKRSLY